MTNVFSTPEKGAMKTRLFSIGVEALESRGWTVQRVRGSGKSSVRRITKGTQSKIVSIRTSQDAWIAFPRTEGDKTWKTLDEVEEVVAVSVDNKDSPRFANVHVIPASEMRLRFDRAYKARKAAGYTLPVGRGVWLSLYHEESSNPVTHVGAGAGLAFPPILQEPLTPEFIADVKAAVEERGDDDFEEPAAAKEAPLTIAEAKRRLAISLGVDPSSIKITVEA